LSDALACQQEFNSLLEPQQQLNVVQKI